MIVIVPQRPKPLSKSSNYLKKDENALLQYPNLKTKPMLFDTLPHELVKPIDWIRVNATKMMRYTIYFFDK